jgi:hypothetical protein
MPVTGRGGLIRLKDVDNPTLFRQLAHSWRLGCQPYTLAALYSTEIFFVIASAKGYPSAIVRMEGLSKLKKKINDLIGTQT